MGCPMNEVEKYVHLDRDALERLPFADRVHLLSELTRTVPQWLAATRAEEIDRARSSGRSDQEIAAELGTSVQALNDVGDGPALQVGGAWVRPRLLLRTAELLAEHAQGLNPVAARDLHAALGALRYRGRPDRVQIQGAARRIANAFRNVDLDEDEITAEERRLLRRGVAHAAKAATGPVSNHVP